MPAPNNGNGRAIPWWMFDLDNLQLFTSVHVPTDIADQKGIVLTETPVPGKNYATVFPAGGSNRKVSFTIPLVQRNGDVGNVFLLKAYDSLRNQATGFFKSTAGQFTRAPKVLYNWGIGTVPLVWWVSKADATHKQGWINRYGMPMYSEISIELTLDETSPAYRAEEIWRNYASVIGNITGISQQIGGY